MFLCRLHGECQNTHFSSKMRMFWMAWTASLGCFVVCTQCRGLGNNLVRLRFRLGASQSFMSMEVHVCVQEIEKERTLQLTHFPFPHNSTSLKQKHACKKNFRSCNPQKPWTSFSMKGISLSEIWLGQENMQQLWPLICLRPHCCLVCWQESNILIQKTQQPCTA